MTRRLPVQPVRLAVLVAFVLGASALVAAVKEKEGDAARGRNVALRWVSNSSDTSKVFAEVSGLGAAALKQMQAQDGTAPAWDRWLAIYVEHGDWSATIGLPPVHGTCRLESGTLRFEPRFPLEPGLNYRAVFHPARLPGETKPPAELTSVFKVPPRRTAATTVVSRVYPSAGVLPENLLKFYIHFSAPMSRGRIYEHIHLRDAAGKEIELPFLEIDEELWDSGMTRLTLFIDPGRIKRGVRPLEEVGPALEAGKRFILEIDREWHDAAGSLLREPFRKSFEVGRADREPPDPARWKIQSPRGATRDGLAVTFSEPMDHALAQRLIRVVNGAGKTLAGAAVLSEEERRWTFTPASPWRAGPHQLWVQTTIEDLAGNNIGKPFEVDLLEPIQQHLDRSSVKLPFEIPR